MDKPRPCTDGTVGGFDAWFPLLPCAASLLAAAIGGMCVDEPSSDLRQIRTNDVRRRAERIQQLPRSRHKRRGRPGAQCSRYIPRMRRHHAQRRNLHIDLLGGHVIRLRRRLEALHGIGREDSVEEPVEVGVHHLVVQCVGRAVAERRHPKPGRLQSL